MNITRTPYPGIDAREDPPHQKPHEITVELGSFHLEANTSVSSVRRRRHGVDRGQPLTDPSPGTIPHTCSPSPALVASCPSPFKFTQEPFFFCTSILDQYIYLLNRFVRSPTDQLPNFRISFVHISTRLPIDNHMQIVHPTWILGTPSSLTLVYIPDHYCPPYILVLSMQCDHPPLTLPPPHVMTLFSILLYVDDFFLIVTVVIRSLNTNTAPPRQCHHPFGVESHSVPSPPRLSPRHLPTWRFLSTSPSPFRHLLSSLVVSFFNVPCLVLILCALYFLPLSLSLFLYTVPEIVP